MNVFSNFFKNALFLKKKIIEVSRWRMMHFRFIIAYQGLNDKGCSLKIICLYIKVSEVAGYESEVKIKIFKMTDLIWRL